MKTIALLLDDRTLRKIEQGLSEWVSPSFRYQIIKKEFGGSFIFTQLQSLNPDGIIMDYDASILETLGSLEIPIILLLSEILMEGTICLNWNDFELGKLAGNYFKTKGIRNLAFCGKIEPFSLEKSRGLSAGSYNISQKIHCYIDSSETDLEPWLDKLQKPVGILSDDDQITESILSYCANKGIKIPEEISIISSTAESFLHSLSYPTVSSVNLPWRSLGRQAGEWIIRLMDGSPLPDDSILLNPIGIQTRASTDFIHASQPVIQKTMAYLRENPKEIPTVQILCNRINYDRRHVEKEFRKHLNRSPGQIIRMHRLERAKELLESTRLPIGEIANECGYSKQDRLSKNFKSQYSMSPSEWRKQYVRS